jgi:glycosyltransferase involved in cell wall biosynthesis
MEGTSKEVFGLQKHFPNSIILGLSRHYWLKASLQKRYFGINLRGYPFFRLMAPLLESRTCINHIYGSNAEYFFLRALRRRPIILTAAIACAPLDPKLYRHVTRFVAHSNQVIREMVQRGIDPESARVIYPGIDLDRHCPAPLSNKGTFRVLFATAPTDVQGFKDRGVALLFEVASVLRDVEFDLIWRPWGNAVRMAQSSIAEKGLTNVHLHLGLVRKMTDMFAAADATIAPFLHSGDMKSCPTSLVESLACGRPIVVSNCVGIADLVEQEKCGEVSAPTVAGICAAIERLRQHHDLYVKNSRSCAERHFSLQSCLKNYDTLYKEVLPSKP